MVERRFSIPSGYGEDRITLMVKDPCWLYAYWEIQPETRRAAGRQLLPHEVAGLQSVLRVYDVTGVAVAEQAALRFFDVPLSDLATDWYIQTSEPSRSFLADIGLLTKTGRFLRLARSNRVTTPSRGPSAVIDKAWAPSEEAFRVLAEGPCIGVGSAGWTSPTVAQRGPRLSTQGFRCQVSTDVVIYGQTDPKATVRIQGEPVTVRRDGTFSLRVTVANASQTIMVEAISPDGQQTRTVTPLVIGSAQDACGATPTPS